MKHLRYRLEYAATALIFRGFAALPLDAASWLGGWMARAIGPFLGAQKTARENLERMLPHLTEREIRKILNAMWDNLGRTAAELPHLPGEALHKRVTIEGLEQLAPPDQQTIFYSAHMGNWELAAPLAHNRGTRLTVVYRRINNPFVDHLVAAIRGTRCHNQIAKGPKNAFKLIRAFKNGDSVAMLIDQKMNDGIAVPFFGHPAMTPTATADLALQFGLPLVPARIIRTGGAHFRAIVGPALDYTPTGNREQDVLAIMTRINAQLESWIRETPEQWFWVHRRWPKEG